MQDTAVKIHPADVSRQVIILKGFFLRHNYGLFREGRQKILQSCFRRRGILSVFLTLPDRGFRGNPRLWDKVFTITGKLKAYENERGEKESGPDLALGRAPGGDDDRGMRAVRPHGALL